MARRRMVIWQGISLLDGVTPLVVLATFDTRANHSSDNVKTGDMVQIFIMRADMPPLDAIKIGADVAICGTCPHRSIASEGTGACYVNVGQAPRSVWLAWSKDGTRPLTKTGKRNHADSIPFDVELLRGRRIRFGTYGDPAAVPFDIWQQIAGAAAGITGYTHQWRSADRRFATLLMASADSPSEGKQAKAIGYRSFIVRSADAPRPRGAIACPASKEAGHRTVCASCMQCGGTGNGKTRDISIIAHGATARRFKALPLAVI